MSAEYYGMETQEASKLGIDKGKIIPKRYISIKWEIYNFPTSINISSILLIMLNKINVILNS